MANELTFDGVKKIDEGLALLVEEVNDLNERFSKWQSVAVAYKRWHEALVKFSVSEMTNGPLANDLSTKAIALEKAISDLGPDWQKALEDTSE